MYSFGRFKEIGLILIILLGITLFFIDPEYSSFVPKCPFRWFTGLNCPACGSQRAIHQLLHLNIKRAFEYNPFLILSLPDRSSDYTMVWSPQPTDYIEKAMPPSNNRQYILDLNHRMVDCPEYPTDLPWCNSINHITHGIHFRIKDTRERLWNVFDSKVIRL